MVDYLTRLWPFWTQLNHFEKLKPVDYCICCVLLNAWKLCNWFPYISLKINLRFHSYTQNSRFNTNISWCKQWWKMLFILMYAIYFSLTIWFLCDFVSWNVYPFNHNTCSLLGHNIPACKISFKEMKTGTQNQFYLWTW